MAKIGIDAYIDVKLFTHPTIRASLSQLFLQVQGVVAVFFCLFKLSYKCALFH